MQARWAPLVRLQQQAQDLLTLLVEFPAEAADLMTEVDELEKASQSSIAEFMSPPVSEYATSPALFIVQAGAGGLEAADFARMLLRMYLKHFDKQHLPYEVLEMSRLGENGIKQATLEFDFPNAYQLLIQEAGTQRLTRVSPYNAVGKKQTSFAAVEVIPLLGEVEVAVNEEDLVWDTYHSGGPGGQGVNTTDSAVRLTHTPSGLVVTIQGRSQTMNKKTARNVLAARLRALQVAEQQEALQAARGARKGSWGTQVRTYNLAGGQYVKDTRTGFTRHDVARVLDGDLQGFMGEVATV